MCPHSQVLGSHGDEFGFSLGGAARDCPTNRRLTKQQLIFTLHDLLDEGEIIFVALDGESAAVIRDCPNLTGVMLFSIAGLGVIFDQSLQHRLLGLFWIGNRSLPGRQL